MAQASLFPRSPEVTGKPQGSDSTRTRKWVVLHNDIVLARIDWSIYQNHIFAMLVSQLGKGDNDFRVQQVDAEELFDLADLRHEHRHRVIANAAKGLVRETFEIRGEDHHYEGYTVFSFCKYLPEKGLIEARFNEDARPFLLQLTKYFTQYQLRYTMRLRSSYAVRFYQIAKMIERPGKPQTQRMDVGYFRELFLIEDKYSRYNDVINRVIAPSVKQVNTATDTNLRIRTIRKYGSPYGKPLEVEWTVWPDALVEDRQREDQRRTQLEQELEPDTFEVWFESQGDKLQRKLRSEAERLVDEESGSKSGPAREALIAIKLRKITEDLRT